ncbi:multidrug DMT transporter permease [Leucobacter sp. UT-8R-CII-1-4]|uniref:multidrug DMT transporter permease n=1 Tax=Leucobacter sp. UT-8R-CII-1-4 TaxID=3040075 RepID=UPI0024A93B64|nr:multidrug DMT transporter permease [Leucobacter sp. UT-8R-CII-1-4]MDI6024515.1 multidrug DMT transporter permease [Leucobacter sp. UT-8R-CII-1-4]
MTPTLLLPAGLNLTEIAEAISLDPKQFWGIPIALVGAAFMSFGAQYQSRGLNKVEVLTGESASSGLSIKHMLGLLGRPSWVVGTILLGLAVVFQIGALSFSPLIVVQPLGVVAMVITAMLNSRITGVKLPKRALVSLCMCVGGIVTFVTVAAFTASDYPVTDAKLITILIIFAIVFAVALIGFLVLRHKAIALFYIVGAGVLYGFVATFAKIMIGRFMQNEFEMLSWICVLALAAGGLLGMLFVQNAYSSGPPDLVIAGLTVVDPLVAILIGIIVLHEAVGAPLWAMVSFVITGVIALIGVIGLAKFHPQVGRNVLEEKSA